MEAVAAAGAAVVVVAAEGNEVTAGQSAKWPKTRHYRSSGWHLVALPGADSTAWPGRTSIEPAIDSLSWGLPYAASMLRQLCVVTTLALVAFRLPWLGRAIDGRSRGIAGRVLLIILFSAVAIVDDRTGLVIETRSGRPVEHLADLRTQDAIIDLRDMIATAAGLCGGAWIGLGVGLLTGIHRWLLGSFVGTAAGLATVVLALFGAALHHAFPGVARNPWRAAAVGVAATLIQRVVILAASAPFADAWQLTLIIFLPKLTTNVAGCSLFALILRTVENDRQALAAKAAAARVAEAELASMATRAELYRETMLRQEAEIRALQAQVEPHFLFNTLNSIKALIREHPDQARACLVKLGLFFRESLAFSGTHLITLEQETAHLRKYLEFQKLRFGSDLIYEEDIDPKLLDITIPPRTLLTLAENALIHGRRGYIAPFRIRVHASQSTTGTDICLTDNGVGVPPDRLEQLGWTPVPSLRGTGTGLFRCREILKRACGDGARLEFVSSVGQGFTVRLTLPASGQP